MNEEIKLPTKSQIDKQINRVIDKHIDRQTDRGISDVHLFVQYRIISHQLIVRHTLRLVLWKTLDASPSSAPRLNR